MIRLLGLLLFWPMMTLAQDIQSVERDFRSIGIAPGAIDGIADQALVGAIQQFQYGYGYPITGRLTPDQAVDLTDIVRTSMSSAPFILIKEPPKSEDRLELFLLTEHYVFGRTLFANGSHYLALHAARSPSPMPGSFSTENRTSFYQAAQARAKQSEERASRNAQNSRDPLSVALMRLHPYPYEEEDAEVATMAGLRGLLNAAKDNPEEPAFTAAFVRGINRRAVLSWGDCNTYDLFGVMRDALDIAEKSGLAPLAWLPVLRATLICVPDNLCDVYYRKLFELATTVSPNAVTAVLLDWARLAETQGADETARALFAAVADRVAAGVVPASVGDTVYGDVLLDHDDMLAMIRLGLQSQVAQFNSVRVQLIQRAPKDRGDSFVALSSYRYLLSSSAELFIRARQFDLMKQVGWYFAQPGTDTERFRGEVDTTYFTQQDHLWEGAMFGLRVVSQEEDFERLDALAVIVLPEMIKDGAIEQAMQLSLLQARGAVSRGDYTVAEASLIRIAALAQSLSATARVAQETADIRRALNLSRLDELPPAPRLLGQLDIYYAAACASQEAAKTSWRHFPGIDYEALGGDPEVASALVKSDAMNKLLGCFFPQRLFQAEVEFICAVAALTGRQDVADFLLNGQWESRERNVDAGFMASCVHGLHNGGKPDWVRATRMPEDPPDQLLFLLMSPDERRRAIDAADLTNMEAYWHVDFVPSKYFEKNLSGKDRAKLTERFRDQFYSNFGRTGPGDEAIHAMSDAAIAYRRMGLYRTAEAYLSIDQRLDPLKLGTETAVTLDAELFQPATLDLRLRYARLYRAEGDSARAYNAIGPLVERAVARLGADEDPLAGTVEQWAKRLEPLFTAYLELQFEGVPQGPNYPVMFAIQQYLQLANSTASASVLEQRLNSVDPTLARQYQDARRALRQAMNGTLDASIAELNQRLQAIEARLPQADAAFSSHQIGVTKTLRDVVLGLRDQGGGMVVITQLRGAAVVMYLDGQGATARKLALSEGAATTTVAVFRKGLLDSDDIADRFDRGLATRLYAELIGWGHAGRPAPARLQLVLTGPLSTLPFAALRRDGGWLGAQAALRLSPTVARAAKGLRSGGDFRGFVGLGDPNLTQGDTAARAALLGQGTFLAELPETANELTFMAISFGGNPSGDVFTRGQASEAQLRRLNGDNRLAEVSILALATHGLLSRETGALNAAGLVMSLPQGPGEDGILTAAEIYGLRIGADLVVLSACNTGTPGAGAGLSDLASAFLYSGAGALLLTHWAIDSGAGVEIMKRIATDQRNPEAQDYPHSLQRAVAGMLRDKDLAKYHHPRFWASHFVLG